MLPASRYFSANLSSVARLPLCGFSRPCVIGLLVAWTQLRICRGCISRQAKVTWAQEPESKDLHLRVRELTEALEVCTAFAMALLLAASVHRVPLTDTGACPHTT